MARAIFGVTAMTKEEYTGRRRIGTKEMMIKLNVSRTVLYHMINNGVVPKPVRLGAKLGWDSHMVDEWLGNTAAEANPPKAA